MAPCWTKTTPAGNTLTGQTPQPRCASLPGQHSAPSVLLLALDVAQAMPA